MANTNNTNNNAKNVATNNESAQKPRALKFVANDDAKREQFSERVAFSCIRAAFQNDTERKGMRAYLEGKGYTQSSLNALTWQELHSDTKSGRFSTYAVLNALVRIAQERDLTGEKAAKEERKAERARLAEARKRIEEEKKAKREEENKAREEKSAKHLAVAKAADATKAADAAAAKAKADAKAARRLAKRNNK